MKTVILAIAIFSNLCTNFPLFSHCQMPCGIYHDEMVYDQIDQYVETMAKGITVINQNSFTNAQDKNAFIRWVISKDRQSNSVAELITSYFLQQKIKPDEEDTAKKLLVAHKMLFALVQIKQHSDMKFVQNFSDEWEKFKLMFHIEGYECRVHKTKFTALEKEQKEQQNRSQQDHEAKHHHSESDHTHDHL